MLAEVYTYPARVVTPVRSRRSRPPLPRTPAAGKLLAKRSADKGGDVTITDLSLAMPDCSAIDDILVLNNIDPDLKLLAAN